jgi:acetyl-CoA C-acetyltransferase
MAKLKPAFSKTGTVTAGNSSGLNDAAGAVVLMNGETAEKRGLKPMARLVAYSLVGVEPKYMGIGPVTAIRKVLQKSGLRLDEMDLIELNEAFAAQSLAVIKELELPRDRTNPNGGAIALGHQSAPAVASSPSRRFTNYIVFKAIMPWFRCVSAAVRA